MRKFCAAFLILSIFPLAFIMDNALAAFAMVGAYCWATYELFFRKERN